LDFKVDGKNMVYPYATKFVCTACGYTYPSREVALETNFCKGCGLPHNGIYENRYNFVVANTDFLFL